MAVLLLLVAAITALCIQASLNWIGRPFNGFLLGRNRIVAPIAQPSWSGPRAGVPYRSQLVAINGAAVTDSRQALAAAAHAGPGADLAYTFVRDGQTVTLRIPVITFTVGDYLGLFGNYLVNGLAFLAIGFFVVWLRPQSRAAAAMLLVCLSWGLVMITSLEDFATYQFRALLAAAHAAAPASLLYLTLRFPTEHAWGRRRTVRVLLLGSSAALAALDIGLYDRAPALWMRYFDLWVVWMAVAVLGSVALMWNQYRSAASALARERLKIVFLGAVVAFALPSAATLGSYGIGAELPLNMLFTVTWLFPAALAYAIVKRDLFEIDAFLRRAASYAALSAAVFALYVAVVGALSRIFHGLSVAASPWFTLFFSLGMLAVVRPLRDWLQAGVDRLFFRTHFDYIEITEALSQILGRTLDAGEITAHVQRAIAATMAPASCTIFTRAAADGLFRCTDSTGADLSLDAGVIELLAAGQLLTASDLPAATMHNQPAPALIVPLCCETRLEGLLLLGPKKSGAPYGPRDLELIRALAKQTATAVRNAHSYGQVTALLSSLEARVEQRTHELRETQAELQASNEKLREMDRLKTRFFSEVSHELRTPLTLVLGPLEQLRMHAATWTPETRRLLDLAHSSSAKLLVLTDTLLDLSRLDAGRMQPVLRAEQLEPLLERTVEPFLWLAEQRGVSLRLRQTDAPVTVWCDATMVSKIVGNLLANALKFTSSGMIDLDVQAAADRIGIRVADTGPGIPAAELPHIFDRYQQASTASHTSVSGSGLGLALVRDLAELHGGSVEASSELGRGTTVTVWLPSGRPANVPLGATGSRPEIPSAHLAALAAARHSVAPAATSAVATGATPIALVIDDNAGLLDFVAGLLAADYQVHTAPNAQQALAVVHTLRPDIILCDVMMPGPDGVTFCQTLKRDETLRHIPLILLTARASLESKLTGLEAGADDYITKPFHPEELKARMAALLRMRQMERELSRSHAELARAFNDLRDAQAQLIHVEKMASLGTLVAGVAHEINNPVSFVNSSIDLISTSITEMRRILDRHLQHGAGDPALQRLWGDLDYEYRMQMLQENAAICREGASRAARIVNDLRTFCRPGSGRREPADLHASLDQSLRLLQGECKGRITVHRDYADIPRVPCDQGQISQVFLNLLANAIQAIDGAGDVFVRTRSANGSVIVEIEDTGHGMDADVAARVFDPFFTTKDVGKGTGLGLSIVRSLVTAHGGDIQVRSAVGQGSVFTVSLPIHGGPND